MEKWIGHILVDLSPPERVKFKSPLILVHGLWTSGRCWRLWATHFSNLGWECWAVNFRGRFGENAFESLKSLSFQDCVEDLKEVIRACAFPPVLLAHDLGGRVALKAAEEEKLSALILLESLLPREVMTELPRSLRLLRLKYSLLLFFRRPFRIEDGDLRQNWLNSLPRSEHAGALSCLVADSSHLIREFFDRRIALDPRSVHSPILVVGGREDRVVAASSLRDLAKWLGADFREYADHGHWIMSEGDSEEIVRDIHRWIVQKSGEKLLIGENEL